MVAGLLLFFRQKITAFLSLFPLFSFFRDGRFSSAAIPIYRLVRGEPVTRQRAGFTLVELMVTIAVLALVSALGSMHFFKHMPERRIESASRTVYACLQKARSEAIRAGEKMAVNFDVNNDSLNIADAGGNVIASRRLSECIDLHDVTSGNPFVFNSRGMKIGIYGAVYLRYGKKGKLRRRVRVTPVGGIAIQYPAGANGWQ